MTNPRMLPSEEELEEEKMLEKFLHFHRKIMTKESKDDSGLSAEEREYKIITLKEQGSAYLKNHSLAYHYRRAEAYNSYKQAAALGDCVALFNLSQMGYQNAQKDLHDFGGCDVENSACYCHYAIRYGSSHQELMANATLLLMHIWDIAQRSWLTPRVIYHTGMSLNLNDPRYKDQEARFQNLAVSRKISYPSTWISGHDFKWFSILMDEHADPWEDVHPKLGIEIAKDLFNYRYKECKKQVDEIVKSTGLSKDVVSVVLSHIVEPVFFTRQWIDQIEGTKLSADIKKHAKEQRDQSERLSLWKKKKPQIKEEGTELKDVREIKWGAGDHKRR